jgi:hypothetical protein
VPFILNGAASVTNQLRFANRHHLAFLAYSFGGNKMKLTMVQQQNNSPFFSIFYQGNSQSILKSFVSIGIFYHQFLQIGSFCC